MTLLTLNEAKTFENAGFTFHPLAVPSRGSTELAVWTVEVAPGTASELHSVSREEVFVLQHGEILAEVDGVEHRPAAGTPSSCRPTRPPGSRTAGAWSPG